MSEREKIVKWLRREADLWRKNPSDPDGRFVLKDQARAVEVDRLAHQIECGAHLKRPEPTIPASEWVKTPSVGH